MCPNRDCWPAGAARGSVAKVQLCFADGFAAEGDFAEAAETMTMTATAAARIMSEDFMTTPFGWGQLECRRRRSSCTQAVVKPAAKTRSCLSRAPRKTGE